MAFAADPERHLIISDLQMPFEAKFALPFCLSLKRAFRIPDENIINAGDEADENFAGMYPKDPDADLTGNAEIDLTRDKFKEWGSAFPKMRLCVSNHGIRWIKKAAHAEIPSQVLKSYQELYRTPRYWIWQDEWRFTKLKHPFRVIHGMGYSGQIGHINAALDGGISTAIGHLHSHAGINHILTKGRDKMIWAFNTGCLIDPAKYAFKYEKENRRKPCRGVGIVLESGSTPIWIPYPYAE